MAAGFTVPRSMSMRHERSGAYIHNPCVNRSELETTVKGKEVYLGFQHIKAMGSELAEGIVFERLTNGPFIIDGKFRFPCPYWN